VAWGVATAITAGFTAYAVFTTSASEMFEMAEGEMAGPRLARAFQTIAWYLAHYVWPVNLGPWHPPVPVVAWSDSNIILSVVLALLCVVAAGVSWRVGRSGVVGMLWFLGAIFSTLPAVASRAILAGERYLYLPGIGLHWMAAAGAVWLFVQLSKRAHRQAIVAVAAVALIVVSAVFVRIARATGRYYENSITLAHRIIELYPDQPDVFVDLAWAYIRAGQYDKGIEYANRQYEHPPADECLINQAIAWAWFEKGDTEQAEQFLLRARQANPEYSKVYYRLAEVYVAQGHLAEAEQSYKHSVELTPLYLPAQDGLARLYMNTGRYVQAERVYRTILENVNPYHPPARYNLGNILMSRHNYTLAIEQYKKLLSYMPEHTMARTNLGVCLLRRGDERGALRAWDEALRREPGLLPARLNRAALYTTQGRVTAAEADYASVLREHPAQREALSAVSKLLETNGRAGESVAYWRAAVGVEPEAADLRGGLAWALCQSDEYPAAVEIARDALATDSSLYLANLALGVAYYREAKIDEAEKAFVAVAQRGIEYTAAAAPADYREAVTRGMEALARLISAAPESPWPYYFTSLLLAGLERWEDASLVLEQEFCRRCEEFSWRRRAREVLDSLRPTRISPGVGEGPL
jgi:tetratricopeptide (TPR) repeat protein